MEIEEMNINDIEDAMKEIRSQMDAEDADLDALSAKVDAIEKRKADLKAEEERKADLRKRVAEGSTGIAVRGAEAQKENKMNEFETRAKDFAESGKMELRAVLASGKIATPASAASEVNGLAEVASNIVDDVNAIALTGTGAWKVAYKATEAAAATVTDGSAIGGTAATFDYVTINPDEWGITDQVSNQVKKMTPINYLAAVEKSALIALRAKAAAVIVANIKASAIVEKKTTVSLDADYLKNLALGFRSIEGKGNVCLYIAQADLLTLGKVRGTNEKRALYDIAFDAGTTTAGTISEGGLAVRFRVLDQLSVGEQLFGQPGTVDMPMWDNYEISTDEGGKYFEANQLGIRGLQTANADLVAYHGMQYITQ